MEQSVTFNVGGVPEHFNLPWHQAINEGIFSQESITVNWNDYPGGTGAMAKDLRNGVIDVAVLLTEGIVADIAKGNECRIIGVYVLSPLIWGIHVSSTGKYTNIEDLEGKKYAISRLGSGSHLMAFVDAQQRGWNITNEQLILVGDLEGAREALKTDKAQIFMWEKFMTKPLVDKGEFSRVGECPTPWPCFVIAVRNEIIDKYSPALQNLLKVIYTANQTFMTSNTSPSLVADKFNLTLPDANAWFAGTKWAVENQLPTDMLQKVSRTLHDLKLINSVPAPEDLYVNIFK